MVSMGFIFLIQVAAKLLVKKGLVYVCYFGDE